MINKERDYYSFLASKMISPQNGISTDEAISHHTAV